MVETLLSIVIPAYNVERYLCACLDSVVQQDNGRIEVVLVDDGSTDGTGALCDEYGARFSFIQVYHRENGGLSAARNTGIRHATGRYVSFLDSDDRLAPGAVERICRAAESEQPDVVITRYATIGDDPAQAAVPCAYHLDGERVRALQGEALLSYVMEGRIYDWYAVLLVVRRAFLQERELWFCEGVTFEDARWTPAVLLAAAQVVYVDPVVYEYRQGRAGSITMSVSPANYESRLGVFPFFEELSRQHGLAADTRRKLLANMANLYVSVLADAGYFPPQQRRAYRQQLRPYRWILSCSQRRYHRMLAVVWAVLGQRAVSALLYRRAVWVRRRLAQ